MCFEFGNTWHWSAFLALWLSQNVGYISTFLALFPIFCSGFGKYGFGFSSHQVLSRIHVQVIFTTVQCTVHKWTVQLDNTWCQHSLRFVNWILYIAKKIRNVIQVPQFLTHSIKSQPLYTCTVQQLTRDPLEYKTDFSSRQLETDQSISVV